MNRLIFNSKSKRNKAIALVGTISFLLTGTLAIWGGILVAKSLGSWTTQAIQTSVAQSSIKKITTTIEVLPEPQHLDRLREAQSLFAIQPLLNRDSLKGNLYD